MEATHIMLTPFNFFEWKAEMVIQLRAKGLFKGIMGTEVEPVATFHTPGSRGKNIQATRCVLGGKSRVKAVTLVLTPLFRLDS